MSDFSWSESSSRPITMSAQAKLVPNASMVYHSFPLASSLLAALLLRLLPCTAAASEHLSSEPLVAPINLDVSTHLQSIVIKNGNERLVVDLAGPLVWSTCPGKHGTIPCDSAACRAANRQHHPHRCRYVDAGWFGAGREPGSSSGCACAAHPANPVTGECSTGDLTAFALSARATDGRSALDAVDLPAVVSSCAPGRLLGSPPSSSLPAAATGVAGFSRSSPLSLPSQLAARRGSGSGNNRFALCLPDGGGGSFLGFAMFGNTTVHLGRHLPEITSSIPYFPLARNNPKNGGYYLPVKAVSVRGKETVEVGLPAGALDVDANRGGRGGVTLSTVTRHMTMRTDVYRAFLQAYDTAVQRNGYAVERVAAVPPFELCYNESMLRLKQRFYDVPAISLEIAGAPQAWTVPGVDLLQARGGPVCVGVVEMGRDAKGAPEDEPAVVLGLDQLSGHLLVFDLDKGVVGFSNPLVYMDITCTEFYYRTH